MPVRRAHRATHRLNKSPPEGDQEYALHCEELDGGGVDAYRGGLTTAGGGAQPTSQVHHANEVNKEKADHSFVICIFS